MHINSKEKIAGLPVMQIRKLLKKLSNGNFFQINFVSRYFNATIADTKDILNRLIESGYVELNPNSQDDPGYRTTIKGNSLSMSSAAKPLLRSTVERKKKEFLKRVEQVNANEYYLYKIKEVIVFGSYLTSKEYLNDIDLAVELIPKYDKEKWWEMVEKRFIEAEREGKRHGGSPGYFGMLHYAEICKFLKGRSRTISLHDASEPILKKVEKKVIFQQSAE